MARMAVAAAEGGAVGIRANGPADIRAIRKSVRLPIIGLYKQGSGAVYITPNWAAAAAVARADADWVALDATADLRPDGLSLAETIGRLHEEFGVRVLADVGTFAAGIAAERAGADAVATTLSGYQGRGPVPVGPDLRLVRALAGRLRIPVVAEGRFATPAQVGRALQAGARAVVVGAAITRPQWITARFVAGIAGWAGRRAGGLR